jgi:hypothetical protein
MLTGCPPPGASTWKPFYGCIYYAATRPSEAVLLTEPDLTLPSRGWGRIDLATSAARAGRDWTDDGTARQARGLKHRAQHETRSVPIPPVLVAMLRAHLRAYGTPPDGRLFRTSRGGLIQDSAYSAVWQAARAAALTPAQHASPLAHRPYDLRHAAVSLWLNAGVPATEGRPPRRAQRRRPAQGLRPLHRRTGRQRQQAHRRRPRQRRQPRQRGRPRRLTVPAGHGQPSVPVRTGMGAGIRERCPAGRVITGTDPPTIPRSAAHCGGRHLRYLGAPGLELLAAALLMRSRDGLAGIPAVRSRGLTGRAAGIHVCRSRPKGPVSGSMRVRRA